MQRQILKTYFQAIVLTGSAVLSCAPVHAQQTGVQYNILNRLTQKVIDVPTTCNLNAGCLLQQWDAMGFEWQDWSLVNADTRFFNIVSQHSGMVIDVPTPQCSDQSGCQLQQYGSNGSWQQQWTLVPADTAGQFNVMNRLSGKVIDVPTPQCSADNGCILQQYDPNGSWQQQWQFVPVGAGTGTPPPPGGVTILVNGSFDDDPSWVNASDPEYQAIASTFGDQPVDYQWTPNSFVFAPLYLDIFNGGSDFAAFVNALNIPASQSLTVVAHSHGGNVVKLASYNLSHPINNLINLGTPQNWDLPEINLSGIGNYCQVSSLADFTQFSGASPIQVGSYGYDIYLAGEWLAQEGLDLYEGNYADALYDAEMEAYYDADAFFWFMSTKLAFGAYNVVYTDLSHSDLHTPPVWADLVHDCGFPQ